MISRIPRLSFFDVKRVGGAVGDGVTNDLDAIQRTIVACAAAGGGTVYFPAGVYLVLCTVSSMLNLYGYSNIRFLGDGDASIIRMSGSSTGSPRLFGNVGSGSTPKSNILFEALSIDLPNVTNAVGISMSNSASRILVENCYFTGLKAGAVRPNGTDIEIAGCRFYGGSVGGYGILTPDTVAMSGLVIVDNIMDGNGGGGDAIEINQPTYGASDVTISNNIIHGWTSGSSVAGIGIGVANVDSVVISGNRIRDCYLDGIHVEDVCGSVTISHNSVRDSQGYGITVQGVTSDAHVCEDLSIVGNTVRSVCTARHDAGILVGGTYVSGDGLSIVGNQVSDVGRSSVNMYGLAVSKSKNGSVIGNVVRNTNGSTTFGIYLDALSDIAVIGNRSFDDQGSPTQDYGIKVNGAMTDVLLLANRLAGNGTGALDESTIGTATRYYKLLNDGITPPAVTGSRGSNAALASLLTVLSAAGVVTDSTS